MSFEDGAFARAKGVVPRAVPFVRIPDVGTALVPAAIEALRSTPEGTDDEASWPWVEVRAHASGDERDVAQQIREAAQQIREAADGKQLHLSKVTVDVEPHARPHASTAPAVDGLDVRQVFLAKWRDEREHGNRRSHPARAGGGDGAGARRGWTGGAETPRQCETRSR